MLKMKLFQLTLLLVVLLLSNNASSSNLSDSIAVSDMPSTDITVASTLALDEDFNSDDIWTDDHWSRSGDYYYVDETNGWLHKEYGGTNDDWVKYSDSFTVPLSMEISGRLTSGGYDYTSPGSRIYMQNGSILGSGVYNEAGQWWTLMDTRPENSYGPQSEGDWFSYRVDVGIDTQELYAKAEEDTNWVLIGTSDKYFADVNIEAIGMYASWDGIIDIDYLKIWSDIVTPEDSTTNPINNNDPVNSDYGDTPINPIFSLCALMLIPIIRRRK